MARKLLLTLAFIVGVMTCMGRTGNRRPIKVGDDMPSFVLIADEGKEIASSKFLGKVILINFFTTWCPPCQKELAAIQKTLWPKYKDNKNFVLLTIGREHSERDLKIYNKEKKFDFPLYPDKNRFIYSAFVDNLIPRSFLVDQQGKIVYTSSGFSDEEFAQLMEKIKELLKKE